MTRPDDEPQTKALHGLTRSLLHNMVEGVTNGYSKTLIIEGVGYRAAKQGKNIVLNLGYSHQVTIAETADIKLEVPQPNQIIVSGIDKQKVGQFACEVRAKRPPEPYKARVSAMTARLSSARKVKPVRRKEVSKESKQLW